MHKYTTFILQLAKISWCILWTNDSGLLHEHQMQKQQFIKPVIAHS
ncbi:MAG TPA: hypothetical protein VLB84_02605 [Bacteroidia bacterium]|nr:hypothetical protein [Bacteroidia bacterium]